MSEYLYSGIDGIGASRGHPSMQDSTGCEPDRWVCSTICMQYRFFARSESPVVLRQQLLWQMQFCADVSGLSSGCLQIFSRHGFRGMLFCARLLMAATGHVPRLPLRFFGWIFTDEGVAVAVQAAPAFLRGCESREEVGVAMQVLCCSYVRHRRRHGMVPDVHRPQRGSSSIANRSRRRSTAPTNHTSLTSVY